MSQVENTSDTGLDSNLLSFPLRSIHGEVEVPIDFYLYQEIGAQQLAEFFPDEIEVLRRPRPDGEVIISVTISSSVDWRKKKSLSALILEPSFSWISIPAKPIAQLEDEDA